MIRVLPSVSKLPDIKCQGTLHSLHQAMMRDEELQKLVEKFVKESNESKRLELTTQIILKWAKAENASTQKNIDAQHLIVVEAFMGYRFGLDAPNQEIILKGINSYTAKQLESIYQKLENYVYAELMSQTHLSDLKKLIKTDKNGKSDLSAVTSRLQIEMALNSDKAKERIVEFSRMVKGLGLDKNSNFLDPKNPDCFYLKFTENDRDLKWQIDSIAKLPMTMDKSKIENNELRGTTGDDAYRATEKDWEITPFFHSLEGDDVLYGSDKDDTLVGCQGEDLLDGGDGDDILISNTQNDIIFGGKGNDRIYAGEDDDIIFGGDGDDVIHPDGVDMSGRFKEGDRGNDIIVGGKGNDIIVSYVGDDTFVFNLGDGNDIIIEKQGTDTLYFGKGISWKNLKFEKNGLDMVISIKNTNDSITVKDWFAEGQVGDNNNIIEIFEFANGEKHTYKDIVVK